MTALVGPSGEGKTTCVSLLERLYEPQEGEILLDNEPLKSYDHHFLHQKVCFCSMFLYLLYVSLGLLSSKVLYVLHKLILTTL